MIIGLLSISTVLAGCSTIKTIEDKDTPIIPANCTSRFDGCNTCFVESGNIGGCTRMACEIQQEPKCIQFTPTKEEIQTPTIDQETSLATETPETMSTIPANCTSRFDGCNNCSVENGKTTACTLMYCETPQEPKCTQFK
ncbi:TPA: hypothetical protein DEP21_05480 [Patescibacteria group bacterium]|nr:hypothetical protein [Candidatus Gracilibacteria bacterium]